MLDKIWHSSRRALNLEYSPSYPFACSQWQYGTQPVTSYLVYRWILFLGVLSIALSSFASQKLPRLYEGPPVGLNYFKWFIYFTNWGYLLIVLQSGLALVVAYKYRTQRTFNIPCEDDKTQMPRRDRTPLVCRAYWLAHTVATDFAFVITLIYWTLVHNPRIHDINMLNILVHGGNSCVMLLELALTSHPFRAAHAIFAAGAGLIYGVFSAFYWVVGGTDRLGSPAIYPALDWNKPASAFAFIALCATVMMFAHVVATCLACVRAYIASRLLPARSQVDRLTIYTHIEEIDSCGVENEDIL